MTKDDILDVGRIAALTLAAWVLPPRFWRKAAIATKRTDRIDRFGPVGKYFLAANHSEAEIARMGVRCASYVRELKLQIMGLNRPWRSWRPDIRLKGEDHLQKALERGHGAILWVTESVFSTLIVKMALHHAGYRACQLSRPYHGFSYSPFGVRFLNPLWARVEDRFIAERLLIQGGYGDAAGDVMDTVRDRLAANGIVYITVAPLAHKFVEVPFLHARLHMPTRPIRLAAETGAALLPVFAFANSDGSFDVSIEEPLNPPGAQNDTESIAAAYAKRLESFVREHPDQWTGWTFNKFGNGPWLQQ